MLNKYIFINMKNIFNLNKLSVSHKNLSENMKRTFKRKFIEIRLIFGIISIFYLQFVIFLPENFDPSLKSKITKIAG